MISAGAARRILQFETLRVTGWSDLSKKLPRHFGPPLDGIAGTLHHHEEAV